MDSYTAQRLIAALPQCLPDAIDELVLALWGRRATRINRGQPPHSFVITGLDGTEDQTVWLSFRISRVGSSSHVQVTLDEATAGPDPTEALADLLDLLAISTAVAAGVGAARA